MKKINKPRWLSYVIVFLIILFLWTTLAAASTDINSEFKPNSPVPGLLNPGNTTFGITIGAIVLLTIVITSAILRKREGS